ncbi:PCNA-associated factor-like [Danaus plexippus]|uniref:PCNA-associated factor-like n=1 Tax=Danaus plexippus TaxID=13037 RepID=UPI002AAFA88F|nr:PCNA-associated factor-like [Danaus plexippus]
MSLVFNLYRVYSVMARTKASVGAKISSGKSSKARCSAAPPPSSTSSTGSGDKSRSASGGNPVCPRETPKWQKPITNFFINKPAEESLETAGSSKPKPRRNVINSDDEEVNNNDEKPRNKELDDSIELEPLTGENSHKIVEYYTKDKGKGKGKKDKENVDNNKRCLEESDERPTKRVKVDP